MPFPTFKTAEEVPEAFRAEYEEKDGAWVPKDDTADLKTALDTERTKREAAERLATKTAGELKKLETKAKAAEAGLTDEQLKKLREDVRGELETEYAPHKETAEKATAENRTLKLDREVKALMATGGVRAEKIEQTWKLYGEHFDLTADGKPMVKAHPGTEVMKYLTDTVKKEVPEFFTGTKGAGGGAAGFTSTPGTSTAIDPLVNPSAALQAARLAGATE